MLKHPKSRLDLYTKEEVATLLGMSPEDFEVYWASQRGKLEEGVEYEVFIYADALPKLIDDQAG